VEHDPPPLDILFKIRSPHHYLPSTFVRDFMPLAAWHLIGIGAGWPLLRDIRGRAARLGALLGSMLILIWIATALTTSIYEPRVAQLFVWRLAPYSEMLCQLLAAGALVRAIAEPRFSRRYSAIHLAQVVAGFGLFLAYQGGTGSTEWRKNLSYALLALLAAKLVHVGVEVAKGRGAVVGKRAGELAAFVAPLALAAALLANDAADPLRSYRQRSNLITGLHPAERELVEWMRHSTPRDAVFLTPPAIETLRYHGQRAIVADWKSHPMLLDEVVGWYRRIQDVTGRERFRSSADLAGYDTLDQARLDFLKQKYGFDYVIVGPGREHGLRGRRVFANRGFVVLDVR
jgi:hypothetical protein